MLSTTRTVAGWATGSRAWILASSSRRAILNAATDLFAAFGYGAASMDAVAPLVDVPKATVSAHCDFGKRMFATIVQVACLENILLADDLPDGPTDVEDALRAIGTRILRLFRCVRSRAIHRLVIAESVRFAECDHDFMQ
jgi:TetR/AcrR family transcriptional regulator, mexJK operon transcriptional repressor